MNSCAARQLRNGLIMLAAFLLAGHGPVLLNAASRTECRTMRSENLGRAVRYCAILPASYDADTSRRYPVLYYLHGLGDNESSLVRFGGWELVERLQEKKQIGEFLIIVPDGGRTFYINSRDGKTRYDDFFIKEFIPGMEKRYRALGSRAGRGISGTSMGGYGALRFAFRHPDMFASVSVHSAVLVENLGGDISDSLGRNSPFGSPMDIAFWNENNPLELARTAQNLRNLKIYFDCGRQDEFGFDTGAELLHKILEQRSIPHEFHFYPGNHSWEYVAEHFDESLIFQSAALAAKK